MRRFVNATRRKTLFKDSLKPFGWLVGLVGWLVGWLVGLVDCDM